jgi:hypothetical protein
MTVLQKKNIADDAVDADKIDLADDYAWTGEHDFTAGTVLAPTPTLDAHAATKAYVDGVAIGLKWRSPVRVRAQGNIDLSAPGAIIDGITMSVDDRVCCDQQTTGTEDGFYLWKGAATPMVRTDDAATGMGFAGIAFFAEEGTDADKGFVCSNDQGSDVIGTDALTMAYFSGAVGAHAIGGASHTADTLANLNTKISDADVAGIGNANTWTRKQTTTPSVAEDALAANGGDNASGNAGAGVVGTGGDSSGGDGNGGDGGVLTGGALNGSGADGAGARCTGGGTTGTGLIAIGASNGCGLVAQADASTPVRAALRLVPQDAVASGPLEGDIQKITSGRFIGYAAAAKTLDEERIQVMHLVTAGEVTAGYFTLATNPVNAQSVRVAIVGGLPQVNKQVVGATGATPDFDVLSTNQVHINNNGAATGLSGDITTDDVLIVDYVK